MPVLNVLPAEFQTMLLLADRDSLEGTDTLASWCQDQFGCEPFAPYMIRIQWEAPAIPWLSQGIHRIEEDIQCQVETVR